MRKSVGNDVEWKEAATCVWHCVVSVLYCVHWLLIILHRMKCKRGHYTMVMSFCLFVCFSVCFQKLTTCMENLEMSGILLKVREEILSGKSGLKLFVVSCIFASILDIAEFVHFILVLDHALLQSYPTTDKYTSTGRIWVTLNMAGVLRTIMKLSGNFTLSAEWSPCKQFRAMFAVDGRPTSAFQRTHSRTHRITLNNSKPCLLPHRKLHPTVNLAEAAAALPGYLLISLWTG